MEARLAAHVDHLESRRAQDHRELRSALAVASRAGLSQRAIAESIGKSQPEVRRLIAASAARTAQGARRTWMTARSAVDAVTRELRHGDEVMALKMLIQAMVHLRGLEDPDDIAEWAVTPARIPHEGFEALLQALTLREFRALGMAAPSWADPSPLRQDWVLAAVPGREGLVRARTPDFLASLGVYVSDRDLVTA